jgi:uncharacterized membrane protein YhiD involved in acid resistance
MCIKTAEPYMENIGMLANIGTIVAAIAAIIAIIVTVKSLRTSIEQFNKQLQLNFFAEYTKRYQEIILNFPESINQDDFNFDNLPEKERDKTLRYMRVYFDLCSEEYSLHKSKHIDEKTWEEWESGIKYAISKTAFREAWRIIAKDTRYYTEFASFVNKIINKNTYRDRDGHR